MMDVILPIFDVRLLTITGTGITLGGIELCTREIDGKRRMVELQQIWRCAFVVDAGDDDVSSVGLSPGGRQEPRGSVVEAT